MKSITKDTPPTVNKQITIDDLESWGACYWYCKDRNLELTARCEAALPATLLEVANCDWVPEVDRLWVLLHPEVIPEKALHLLACEFAEAVLPAFESAYPDDTRPRDAITAKRRWVAGRLTDEELAAARSAAVSAARSAARSAAESAAVSAARSAVESAAPSAAWSAARSAAWSTAPSAARKQLDAVITVLKQLGAK